VQPIHRLRVADGRTLHSDILIRPLLTSCGTRAGSSDIPAHSRTRRCRRWKLDAASRSQGDRRLDRQRAREDGCHGGQGVGLAAHGGAGDGRPVPGSTPSGGCAKCRREESFEPLPPNDRGWVKVKNRNYWRRDAEREVMAREARALGRQPISLILG
jgi:hypothetical protein